jgi:hypothetical protein
MALQNVAWALTGRGLMDCLQYYDNCLLLLIVMSKLLFIKVNNKNAIFMPRHDNCKEGYKQVNIC